jgi:BRCT domain type II-containing protein
MEFRTGGQISDAVPAGDPHKPLPANRVAHGSTATRSDQGSTSQTSRRSTSTPIR